MKKLLQSKAFYLSLAFLTQGIVTGYSQCATNLNITVNSGIICNGDTSGSITVSAPSAQGLMISEIDLGSPDYIEITNVSGGNFDATGYYVITSDSYGLINDPNPLTWNLSGILPANWVDYREDVAGTNDWGNNLLYNTGSPGWICIVDGNNGHEIVDAVFWGWSALDIATFAPVIGGNNITLGSSWTGAGINPSCGLTLHRSDNLDDNELRAYLTSLIYQQLVEVLQVKYGIQEMQQLISLD